MLFRNLKKGEKLSSLSKKHLTVQICLKYDFWSKHDVTKHPSGWQNIWVIKTCLDCTTVTAFVHLCLHPHTSTGMCLGPISQIQFSNGNIAEVGSHILCLDFPLCVWTVSGCTNLWGHAWRCAGQNSKILPPGPAARWFGFLCVVQQTGALPCLETLAVALCDGLKIWHRTTSGQQLWNHCSSSVVERSINILRMQGWAVGSGHLCPCP